MNKCRPTGTIHNIIARQKNLAQRYTRHFCVSQYEKFGRIAEYERVRFIVRPVYCFLINIKYGINSGPGSVVGIATGYGQDSQGMESRCGRDFPHPFRPALWPTQPPVQWVPGLSRGKERPGHDADPSPPSSSVVMKG